MTPSPALARALTAARPRLNALVAAARTGRSGFDTDALGDAVRVRLGPLVDAVEALDPARTEAVVEAGFALSVDLVAAGLSGDRRRWVDRAWARAGAALAPLVADEPRAVLATLTNGVLTVAGTPGARPDQWLALMATLAPVATPDTIAPAGQIAAWRSGMAHLRTGALALADTLPEAVTLAALGLTGRWSDLRDRLAQDLWWTPDGTPAPAVRVGGFTGFGGPFAEPPEVRASAAGFLVRSGDRHRLLVADAWGATLHPADAAEFDAAARAIPATATATLPPERLTHAVHAGSVAYASPYSHWIEVGPWRN